MSSNYIFDDNDIRFRKKKTSVWAVIRRILMFFVASLSLAVLYYIIFSLFFSTEEERRLKHENRMYEKEYPELEKKERMLADVVEGLKAKDDRIYEEIFHTSSPGVDPMSSLGFLEGIDSIPDNDIVLYSAGRLENLKASAANVEENFMKIMETVQQEGFSMPPMTNPLKNFSFAQTGASVGDRINPFYKVSIRHNGLDMIAPSGEPVYAAADGVVRNVLRSRKGLGNVVEIEHGNGYVTRYAHLEDVEVRKGRKLKKGARIGYVGVSGNSFAPHLHYEVLRDTIVLDPVNHFFASVNPEEYMNMVIMSVSTGQSMD
ncbi:MAG: M23 family metallopeptidase [Bacteroidales bacterium]|nr:M23 family metallopeptidase [Bacteroidales bacterium]